MNTWDAIRSRRNVRFFTNEKINDTDLATILEAGRRAPSARNGQPWDFVVVQTADALEQLSHVWRGATHIARSAATVVVVAPAVSDPETGGAIDFDLGQAVMSMALAAASLGIGSGHASIEDQSRLRTLLGLPADKRGACLLALGVPSDRPLTPIARPARRPLDEVVHAGSWGTPFVGDSSGSSSTR